MFHYLKTLPLDEGIQNSLGGSKLGSFSHWLNTQRCHPWGTDRGVCKCRSHPRTSPMAGRKLCCRTDVCISSVSTWHPPGPLEGLLALKGAHVSLSPGFSDVFHIYPHRNLSRSTEATEQPEQVSCWMCSGSVSPQQTVRPRKPSEI